MIFGEEDQTYGRFETDIFVEENAYFELGIFSARVVRSYYEEQLVITAGVEKEWDAALVRPFLGRLMEDNVHWKSLAICMTTS